MKKTILLSEKNILSYLKKRAFPALDFKIKRIVSVKEILSFSNANYLFEADLITSRGEQKIILKQAQPWAKRQYRQGIKRYITPSRVAGEVKMMKLLSKLWGKEYVPEILFYDKKNSVFLMSDVGFGKRLLVKEFEKNRAYPQLGKLFGELFGRLHGQTYDIKKQFNPNRAWHRRLIELLIHQSFAGGMKKYLGEKAVSDFIARAEKQKLSVVWGDPVHRNIYVNKDSAAFFDFDFSGTYDPAFDSGVLLAHWLWLMLNGDRQLAVDAKKFIRGYFKSYGEAFLAEKKGKACDLKPIKARSLKWAGLYLVSRTDGNSGSYFKKYPAWEKRIRQAGIEIFSGKLKSRNSKMISDLFLK